MLSSLFLLLVLAALVGAAAPFGGRRSRPRLAAGLAGWLVLELLAAFVTWVFAGLETWGGDAGAAHRDLAIGGAVCVALLVVPFLQLRRRGR